jgi:hypothetical protein
VLRGLYEPDRLKVKGCGKLRKEELQKLYSSSNIIRKIQRMRMRYGGLVSDQGKCEINIKS